PTRRSSDLLKHKETRRSTIVQHHALSDDHPLTRLEPGENFDLVAKPGPELQDARFERPGLDFDEGAAIEAALDHGRDRNDGALVRTVLVGGLGEHPGLEAPVP